MRIIHNAQLFTHYTSPETKPHITSDFLFSSDSSKYTNLYHGVPQGSVLGAAFTQRHSGDRCKL